MKTTHLIYLGGDSYPADQSSEHTILHALSRYPHIKTYSQSLLIERSSLFSEEDWRLIPLRLKITHDLCSHLDGEDIILIGRSSGARTATLYASKHPTKAVICLGYPFQNPEEGPDPSRYSHLSRLSSPTLIIQGTRDIYGNSDALKQYTLPPTIGVEPIDTDHEFNMSNECWDRVVDRITSFIMEIIIESNLTINEDHFN